MNSYKRLKVSGWVVIMALVLGFLGSIRPLNLVKNLKSEGYSPFKLIESSLTLEVYAEETSRSEVDYYLPYPGMLPDSPFYWVKMIRDRVQLWLITKPVEKTEKLLLYADKRLGAGYSLIDGGKERLGVSTLTKAEKYLEQADLMVGGVEGEGELKEKVKKAKRKHLEVLAMAEKKVNQEFKEILRQMVLVNSADEEVTIQVEVVIDVNGVVDAYKISGAKSALEALELADVEHQLELRVKEYDFGTLVESILGNENSLEKAWIYYVNGESAIVGADEYELKNGDVVLWKYEKPMF